LKQKKGKQENAQTEPWQTKKWSGMFFCPKTTKSKQIHKVSLQGYVLGKINSSTSI